MAIENKNLQERFEFRNIKPEEYPEAAEIEAVCFPPNEACTRERMYQRVMAAKEFFLVAVDRGTGKLAGFINGIATNEQYLRDDFYTDASLHDPDGENIMICSLDVLPEYRLLGLARALVFSYAQREKERGKKRLVLTCLAEKVGMYKKFGFHDLGESASVWGDEKWHEMDMVLNI